MAERAPYYERTLDSFADDIITRQWRERDGSWRAVFDTGLSPYVSDPDFASHGYGATREAAVSKCATVIRRDAQGIGKYAPHSVLVPGYDLQHRLMKHWDRKERFAAASVDPNDAMRDAVGSSKSFQWNLGGEWLEWMRNTREVDFIYRLHLAEMTSAIDGGCPVESGVAKMVDCFAEDVRTSVLIGDQKLQATIDLARGRATDHAATILSLNEPGHAGGDPAGPEL